MRKRMMKKEQVVIPIRLEKETWESFRKLNGKNSLSVIRTLIQGYIVFEVNNKGEKKNDQV
jgi:hypothetical protein